MRQPPTPPSPAWSRDASGRHPRHTRPHKAARWRRDPGRRFEPHRPEPSESLARATRRVRRKRKASALTSALWRTRQRRRSPRPARSSAKASRLESARVGALSASVELGPAGSVAGLVADPAPISQRSERGPRDERVEGVRFERERGNFQAGFANKAGSIHPRNESG